MLLRGLDYVAQEWSLVCLAHNFLKLAKRSPLRGSARNDRADMSCGFWSPIGSYTLLHNEKSRPAC